MSPVAFWLFGRPVYWYGVIIATGVFIGILLAMRYAKKLGYDPEMIVDFGLLAIPLAIIGARLYYVIFEWELYKDDPVSIIKIWEGGLAIYGAVIGGVIAAVIFSARRKIDFWELADIAAPSLILGQALGRWGNFFNQEAYGYAITDPAWQWFPVAVFIDADQQWHMATFFYESVWNFLVFFFLQLYKKKRKRSGEIALFYFILYACGRVVIEGFRTDSLYLGPFRVSQLLSALLIVAGIITFMIRRKGYKEEQQGESNDETEKDIPEKMVEDNIEEGLISDEIKEEESKVESPISDEIKEEESKAESPISKNEIEQ